MSHFHWNSYNTCTWLSGITFFEGPSFLAYWLFAFPQLNSVRWCCRGRAKRENKIHIKIFSDFQRHSDHLHGVDFGTAPEAWCHAIRGSQAHTIQTSTLVLIKRDYKLKRQCHDNRWFLAAILCGKNNGCHRGRPRKTTISRGKPLLLNSFWAVKLFAQLTELSWSDVRDSCVGSRHLLLAQKKRKKTTE